MPSRRFLLLPLLAAALTGCGGEGEQGIKTYRVAKPGDAKPTADVKPADARPAETGGPYRMLGAMFPADNPVWFFKLAGPADQVAKVEKEFDAFLASVKFPNGPDKQPTWDLPPGWKVGTPRKSMFPPFATLIAGDTGLELNASQAGGGLEMNLSRWAGQVGAEPDRAKTTREIATASGAKGLRVDLTGPKNPAGGMGGPFSGGR